MFHCNLNLFFHLKLLQYQQGSLKENQNNDCNHLNFSMSDILELLYHNEQT